MVTNMRAGCGAVIAIWWASAGRCASGARARRTLRGSSGMEYLDGERVRAAISIPAAMSALRSGLPAANPDQPVRTSTSWSGGELLVMPAEGGAVTGVKLVTVG